MDLVIGLGKPGFDAPNGYPVVHAGVPRGLSVYPVPLHRSHHELAFNVTWEPPMGPPVRGYSLEVNSTTMTVDCRSNLCYEYNIPGMARWKLVPEFPSPVPEGCAVRPGCTYRVRLIAHPWDGHTSANLDVELDECVAGVCSCAHARRLPTPVVTARALFVREELYVNVTWSLPVPPEPLRLPPRLRKQYYFISIGKQMVSDVHPAPWFAHTTTRRADATGFVAVPEDKRWLLLPVVERSGERGGERNGERDVERSGDKNDRLRNIILDLKLLARVSLIDERGCVGPAGNATAYDPESSKASIGSYILWAVFGGTVVFAMMVILAVGARAIKRILKAFRPPSTGPLQPLNQRPNWFQLQLHTNGGPRRGQMEESPLYTHREFETDVKSGDGWEVSPTRVHLGALIGSGAFGRVHIAQLDMPGEDTVTVAAKMLTDHATEEEMQDFLREIAMLKHAGSHKHVIRLVACCTLQPPYIALLEHAPRGDLLSLLRTARGKRNVEVEKTSRSDSGVGRPSEADTEYTNLSDSDPTLPDEEKLYTDAPKSRDHYVAEPALQLDCSTMREYALQVALGMRHLEARGITHRDLAARNILVDGAGVLKVADFGLSRSGVYVHTRARPVPLRWLAPEAIFHSQYCNASDVWAFAVLLWEIATLGGFPYAELSNPEVPQFLTDGGRLPKPARASPRLYKLMLECWADDPHERPTFAQIVDKLTAQQQLYVDLDNVFAQDDFITDLDFAREN
ncbi:fibroblast growth factor receptor 4-like [Epargyreus clarus]|uniref:fibroblast growth factor receptor 4-like n=1 Tax=Epargyreus clarus TaxID=520877 RepID=UPI003C2B15EC